MIICRKKDYRVKKRRRGRENGEAGRQRGAVGAD
jgi:hypothetical protein